MNIGAAIRQTRESLGLKLEAVAMEAGFDAGNLSRIETGRQQPSIPRLERIARAMNVNVSDLYRLTEAVAPPPGQLRDDNGAVYHADTQLIRRLYLALNSRHRKMSVEFIKLLNRMQKDEESQSKSP